jgi:hypothetical protein
MKINAAARLQSTLSKAKIKSTTQKLQESFGI